MKLDVVVRNVSLAAAALFAVTCDPPGATVSAEFVERIDSLGFFKYVESSRVEGSKSEVRSRGWVGVFGDHGRLFAADAEDLTEGGVGRFLAEIETFLERQGVTVSGVEDHFRADEYTVVVHGREYLIWGAADQARSEEQVGLLWGLSTVRTFAMVNSLLEEAGSAERLYAVHGGNDLAGFFLTPELREALCQHPSATLDSRPYLPKPEYPWFGQEHE